MYDCMHYKDTNSTLGQNQLAIAKRILTSQIIKYGQDVIWEVVLGAPDRVFTLCLMHDMGKLLIYYTNAKFVNGVNLMKNKKSRSPYANVLETNQHVE